MLTCLNAKGVGLLAYDAGQIILIFILIAVACWYFQQFIYLLVSFLTHFASGGVVRCEQKLFSTFGDRRNSDKFIWEQPRRGWWWWWWEVGKGYFIRVTLWNCKCSHPRHVWRSLFLLIAPFLAYIKLNGKKKTCYMIWYKTERYCILQHCLQIQE